jgi:3-deoxy-D-manno-octulosonic-acid transferase
VNVFLRGGYEAAVNLARAATLIAPESKNKLIRSFAARRGVRARFQTWSALRRDRSRPLLWMHAPSVGEGLQARAVLELVRQRRPEVQLVYTFYSPSAESFADGLDVDFRDYLPFDTVGEARASITAVAPTAFVYSKLDLWPNFTLIASLRGIRLGMISATVAEGSGRRNWIARNLLREAYSRLDAVGAISDDDASRILEVGARPDVVFVTGDTRYDQVWARARAVNPASALLAPFSAPRPRIVAGSTWPADEKRLLPAFEKVRTRHRDVQLIIAPHEPGEDHLRPIEKWARRRDFSLVRLTDKGRSPADADVVLVDRVGLLGELYSLAQIAFVGGGFHDAGLHSVLEPAAFGVPVLFGSAFHNSRDAQVLIRARGASSVKDVGQLYASLDALLGDEMLRSTAGGNARNLVERGTGAADRSYELIDALLSA